MCEFLIFLHNDYYLFIYIANALLLKSDQSKYSEVNDKKRRST